MDARNQTRAGPRCRERDLHDGCSRRVKSVGFPRASIWKLAQPMGAPELVADIAPRRGVVTADADRRAGQLDRGRGRWRHRLRSAEVHPGHLPAETSDVAESHQRRILASQVKRRALDDIAPRRGLVRLIAGKQTAASHGTEPAPEHNPPRREG